MSVQVPSDTEILQEAAEILMKHLGPAKSARFWSIWQSGHGDYLKWKDAVFGQMTVKQLYDEIYEYQTRQPDKQG